MSHERQPFNPALRGYHILYREGQTNICPSCTGTNWYIGRTSAECGFCATVMEMDYSLRSPVSRHTGSVFCRGNGRSGYRRLSLAS